MNGELPTLMLASHAMWVGDYERAFEYYSNSLMDMQRGLYVSDELLLYKVNFELAIISSILEKTKTLDSCVGRLERTFGDLEATQHDIQKRTEKSIEDLRLSIMRRLAKTKRFDIEEIDTLLKEQFPRRRDILTLLIDPRYARSSLWTAIRNAEKIEVPHVYEEGIFRFTMRPELYMVFAKAYCTVELELETLHKCEPLRILVENPSAYYVENESLRTIAGIQREGLVFCHYMPQSSRDAEAFQNVRAFLDILSRAFTGNSN